MGGSFDVEVLNAELNDLRMSAKRASEEKTSLQRQCAAADEMCSQMQREKEAAEERLRAALAALDAATRFQEEVEELKEASLQSEETCSSLKDAVADSRNKRKELMQANCRLQAEAAAANAQLSVARANERDASSAQEAARQQAALLEARVDNLQLEIGKKQVGMTGNSVREGLAGCRQESEK